MPTTGDGMAERVDELNAVLADLVGVLESMSDTPGLLDAVCGEAVRVVPDADLASIMVVRDGVTQTAAFTDERARRIDDVQYAAGDGPGLLAALTGEVVRVAVAETGDQWPEFVAAAKELGVGSYLAVPLRVDDTLVGAITLFGFETHGYHEFDTKVLRLFTLCVETVLRLTRRYREARRLADELRNAMETRAVIEQAKGMLMLIHRVTEDAAMHRLIVESQHTNIKLRDVAARFTKRMSSADGGPARH
ncbi:GAF domain-containing protein [Amycolatopsis tolypomycina]|uniref:GAF domain-containing protein n=2 Tax=Amycolatopsis TaxID=1813 RepID=A0A1H5ASF0_9PSEU|nr:GAF domain-containing protein [Amycolatopsis tolypomycina]